MFQTDKNQKNLSSSTKRNFLDEDDPRQNWNAAKSTEKVMENTSNFTMQITVQVSTKYVDYV